MCYIVSKIGLVILFLLGNNGGGQAPPGGGEVPPGGGAPVATSTTTSTTTTSSSTTCSPWPLPSEVIVLTVAGTSPMQFNNFVMRQKLVQGVAVNRQVNEDQIDYRAFSADMDSCQLKELLGEPIIEMVFFNGKSTMDLDLIKDNDTDNKTAAATAAATAEAAKVPHLSRRAPRDQANIPVVANSSLRKRVIPPSFSNYKQIFGLSVDINPHVAALLSPYHLNWLTAPGANRGLYPQTCM